MSAEYREQFAANADLQAALQRLALLQVLLFVVFVAGFMPALNATNSYAEPVRWIGQQIGSPVGSERRIGYDGSPRKVGAFGYYAEALVDKVESEEAIRDFFRRHPTSLVVVESDRTEKLERSTEVDWSALVVREFDAARRHYVVLKSP